MQSKFSRVQYPKIKFALLCFGAIASIVILLKAMLFVGEFMRTTGITPQTLAALIFGSGTSLKTIQGRTNIVLLGIAGGDHDGADLTDTILILSFHPEAKTLSMISLPRDIWSDTLKDKVNSAYHYGEEKKKGGGIILAKAIISDMVGLPIDYALVFDFSKFREVISLLGGVSVTIPKAFTDAEFPISGKENDLCNGDPLLACRYEPLHFDAGVQLLNGDTALKYVRSRHAEGDEGSDFARSKRQQEVLLALKTKIISKKTYLNPSVMSQLFRTFDKATDTDLNIGELLTVGKLFVNIPQEKIRRISLENELYSPPSSWYGRYVLLPKESFEELHSYVETAIKGK